MTKKTRHKRWTVEDVIEESKKYSARTKFLRGSPGAYGYAYRHGMLDYLYERKKFRTRQETIFDAAKFSGRGDFRRGNTTAYNYATSHNMLDDLFPHERTDWDFLKSRKTTYGIHFFQLTDLTSKPTCCKAKNPLRKKRRKCVTRNEKNHIFMVSEHGMDIKNIKTPSEKIQLAAVNENGLAIQYIQNPSEKVQLAAVQENFRAIAYIPSASNYISKAALASINAEQAYE